MCGILSSKSSNHLTFPSTMLSFFLKQFSKPGLIVLNFMIYFVNVKFIDKGRYVVFRRQLFFLFSPFFYKVEWNA